MKWWLAAAVCSLSLACSPGTSSSEPTDTSQLPTSGLASTRSPASQPTTEQRASSAGDPPTGREHEAGKCFKKQPTIVGTPGDDRIRGTRWDDVIVTLGGNDVVSDLTDWDAVCTGPGDDRVVDERGRHFARIHVKLGRGNDRMTVVDHGGIIRGGVGDDTIVLARRGWPTLAPGAGDDVVRAVPDRGTPIQGSSLCVGFRSAPGPVRVNLNLGRAAGQGGDRLVGIRCVLGSRYNDVLIGTDRNDWMDGGPGLDLLFAGAGNDDVYGGSRADEVHLGPGSDEGNGWGGWDRIYAGPGADLLSGGEDGDYLDGGTGDDYLFAGQWACADEDAADDPTGQAQYSLLETLVDRAPNELFGRSGNDFLSGDRGNDRLDGGAGFDAGTGGFFDGRIDWIDSLERFDDCESPY